MTEIKSAALELGTERIRKLLVQYAVPAIIAMTASSLYNMVDSIFIGHGVGPLAISGLALTFPLMNLAAAFGSLVGVGAATLISMRLGQRDYETAQRVLGNVLVLNLIIGIAFGLVALLFLDPILYFFGASEATIGYAREYMTVILLGIPLTMLYNMEAALLRAVGNSVTPLLFLLFSSVLNVGLDAAFMGPLGLGVRGAAIATVLAQGISAVLGVVYILRGYPELRFTPRQLRAATRRAVTSMFWAGLSMGLMSAIYNLGSVALQSSINALGSVYITAQTAARRLAELYFIPGGALGIGVATFSSQNLGAGRRSRIWQSVKAALAIYFVWWVFVMAFTFLLGGAAIRGITGSTDEVIISNALLYLKISAPVIPPMAVLVILRNMLQGIRHTVEPLLASGLELVGKVIFAVWLVPVRGYRAVCFCEPTTWVVCFVFILLAVWRCRGDLRDAEKI